MGVRIRTGGSGSELTCAACSNPIGILTEGDHDVQVEALYAKHLPLCLPSQRIIRRWRARRPGKRTTD